MNSYHPLILTFVLFFYLGACNSSGLPATPEAVENTVTLKPVPAVLNEQGNSIVDVVKSKIDAGQVKNSGELTKAQFVDANNGWAGSRHVLYRTLDAGRNWKRLNPDVPADSYISSFFFADPRHGWLTVIHKNTISAFGRGGAASIMATTDGGETWIEQLNVGDNSWLQDVSFLDASKGMAVGGRITRDKENSGATMFAFITTDGGKNWNDISGEIVPAIKTEFIPGNDEGNSIRWLSSSRIFILTSRGRVLTSNDNARTWTTLVHFEEDVQSITKSTLYKMLFDPKGRLAILAGSMGEEGYWANLVASDERSSWQSFKLIRVPLLDALVLSERELVACGEEHKLRDERSSSALPSEGIILHSKDNGKTWSPIYRTGSTELLISLTKVNETEFYAVSDVGSFIRFRMK